MKNSFTLLALMVSVLVSGCQSTADYVQDHPDRLGAPAILGVIGATSGYTLGGGGAASVAGAAGLGVAGLGVGILAASYLEKRDGRVIDKALEIVLVGPTNATVSWTNPHTGNEGVLTAMSPTVDFFDQKCRWIRSEPSPTNNPSSLFGVAIDYTAMFKHEDLMLCDRSDGWYITWNERVADRLQQAANQLPHVSSQVSSQVPSHVSSLHRPVLTPTNPTQTDEEE
ncbi:MAG: hypothetical protein O2912_09845 [Proteobacteria bacterium]|nr:hypothetical protein [Pseudomonadota bacterium]